MKYISVALLSLCFVFIIKSQTISITGTVKDYKSNSPIENAKVQIRNSTSGLIDSVFSDAIGNWQYDIATSVEDDIYYLPKQLRSNAKFPQSF